MTLIVRGNVSKVIAVPQGATGAKGDPGGNVDTIGLFADAPGLSIAAGTDAVRTSGHSAVEYGAALYVYDAAVDAAYVSANPLTSFREIGGRGFRLSRQQHVTDYMFGAIDGADNADAIEAWGTFVWANECLRASCISSGTSSRAIVVGGTTTSLTKRLRFAPTITTTAALDVLVTIRNVTKCHIDHAGMLLSGVSSLASGAALATRLAKYGIRWSNCGQMTTSGKITCFNCVHWGALVYDAGTENNNYAQLPAMAFHSCGASTTQGGTYSLPTANWSNPVLVGAASAITQTTTIKVDSVPADDTVANQYGWLAWISGYPYSILSKASNGDGTWTLTLGNPWLLHALVTAGSGTLTYTTGGGLLISGNNSNVITVNHVSAIACGWAALDRSEYGAVFNKLTDDSGCDVWYGFGIEGNGAHYGGKVVSGYLEGTGRLAQVISLGASASQRVVIGRVEGADFDFTKWFKHGTLGNSDTVKSWQNMEEIVRVEGYEGQLLIAQNGSQFSMVYDPPSIASGASVVATLNIPSVRVFHRIAPLFSQDLQGCQLTAYMQSANGTTTNIKFVFTNLTGAAVDLASGTLTATLMQ